MQCWSLEMQREAQKDGNMSRGSEAGMKEASNQGGMGGVILGSRVLHIEVLFIFHKALE